MKVYVVLEMDYDYVDVNTVYLDKELAVQQKERLEKIHQGYDPLFRSEFKIIEKELIGII